VDSAARERLENVLDRELEAAESLSGALADERDALVGKSPADVVQKANEKLTVLRRLEALEQERTALWQATAGRELPGIAQRWQALMAVMARCRTANEVNGYIINLRRGQVAQLLDALRGGSSPLYGPQGKTFGRALRALATA
jgi:flagellar biosynthesis/type III secretory pathway chaperone